MVRRRGAPFGAVVLAAWLAIAAQAVTPHDVQAAAAPPAPLPAEQQLGQGASGPPQPSESPTGWWHEPVAVEPEAAPEPEPEPAEPPTTPAVHDCAVLACVALTFDDGPAEYTGALLDALAAKGVPGTFFVLGIQVEQYPDIVIRMANEGHAIGNHSWSHPRLTSLSPEQAGAQLDATNTVINQLTGLTPTLVRPPYGISDDSVRAVIGQRGAVSVMWSVDTEDWRNRDVGVTTERALTDVEPGAIILMHDIRPTTVEAIPGIVDQLQAAGFTLVTVDELLGPVTPGQSYRHRS